MSKSDTSALFSSIYEELELIENLDIDQIATQIKSMGFECTRCGKCCRGSFADNSVILNSEDLHVLEKKLLKDEFVVPMADISGELRESHLIDENGVLHTFGWMLKRDENRDCGFLENDSKCRIYDSRPFLCRTYPFFLHDGKLEICECEGIGRPISIEEATELATHIIHRKSVELNDTIKVYEKFIESGFTLEEKDVSLLEDIGTVMVHDTEGISRVDVSEF